MSVIKGVMRFEIDGKEIYHEIEGTLSASSEVEKIASKDGVTKTISDQDWTASISALGAKDAAKADTILLATAWKGKTVVPVVFAGAEDGDIAFSGNAYITGFSAKKAKSGALAMDYSLESTDGVLTIGSTVVE